MNKVSLTGRIANDIDLRKTQQGKSVLDISLAVQRERKGPDGKYPVDFIRVNAWEQRAEFLANYAHKGTMIGVTGRIETGSFTNQNGQKVNTTSIQAESVEILAQPQKEDNSKMAGSRADSGKSVDIGPDELPFY